MLDTTPTQAIAEQEPAVASDDERAALLGSLEEFAHALAVYEALIEQHPHEALASAGKGNRLLCLKRLEVALVAYAQALSLAPTLGPVWVGKACALKALQQDQAALQAYDQALALDPTCAPASFGKQETNLERNPNQWRLAVRWCCRGRKSRP